MFCLPHGLYMYYIVGHLASPSDAVSYHIFSYHCVTVPLSIKICVCVVN